MQNLFRFKELKISIHASAKEATRVAPPKKRVQRNFNSRFREGSDLLYRTIKREMGISIHASAKEATGLALFLGIIQLISIHASAKEATLPPTMTLIISMISIHASAKEATTYHLLILKILLFQFTLPRRKRLLLQITFQSSLIFQFTLPRRKRLVSFIYDINNSYFNSRFREGSDPNQTFVRNLNSISIHASAKEATAINTKNLRPFLPNFSQLYLIC